MTEPRSFTHADCVEIIDLLADARDTLEHRRVQLLKILQKPWVSRNLKLINRIFQQILADFPLIQKQLLAPHEPIEELNPLLKSPIRRPTTQPPLEPPESFGIG